MLMNIEEIKGPEDIKTMSVKELEALSSDIRKFLIASIAKTAVIFPATWVSLS